MYTNIYNLIQLHPECTMLTVIIYRKAMFEFCHNHFENHITEFWSVLINIKTALVSETKTNLNRGMYVQCTYTWNMFCFWLEFLIVVLPLVCTPKKKTCTSISFYLLYKHFVLIVALNKQHMSIHITLLYIYIVRCENKNTIKTIVIFILYFSSK